MGTKKLLHESLFLLSLFFLFVKIMQEIENLIGTEDDKSFYLREIYEIKNIDGVRTMTSDG